MGKALLAAVLLACIFVTTEGQANSAFNTNFQITWGGDHVQPSANGQSVQVFLDKTSGANFRTTKSYLFGGFSASIQLPGADSAGVCTAYFLTSDGTNHDELDYEFLGNVTGQPYLVQTNVFADGVGGREERIYVWFNPSQGSHTYSVVWNQQQVLFVIDNIVVRVYGNYEAQGVKYPNTQPMSVYSSIFDASSWATQGGSIPANYAYAPFVATFGGFGLDGCQAVTGASLAACSTDTNNWWSQPSYRTLSAAQINQLRWVRKNYLEYSYCTDTARNPVPPVECALNNP